MLPWQKDRSVGNVVYPEELKYFESQLRTSAFIYLVKDSCIVLFRHLDHRLVFCASAPTWHFCLFMERQNGRIPHRVFSFYICNPDMKPFSLIDRMKWAINDGPLVLFLRILAPSMVNDRMPQPEMMTTQDINHNLEIKQ